MSNRADLIDYRMTLLDLDEPLKTLEQHMPSRTAATQVSRARAMIRAAGQLLATALRERVDGMADALEPPVVPRRVEGEVGAWPR